MPDSFFQRIQAQARNLTEFYALLRQQYPRIPGFHTFSRVGFSTDRQQAVVSAMFACGSLCGRGYMVVLEKINGRWKVLLDKTIFVA